MPSGSGRRPTPSIEEAIREMYGSLSETMHFEHTLHQLGAVFRSNLSALNTEDFGDRRSSVTGVGDVTIEEYVQLTEDYSTRWLGQNIWLRRSARDLLQRGYQHGDAVVAERELRQTEYYRHFLKPLDIRYGMGIHLWSGETNPSDVVVASFHRGHGEVSFDAEDMANAAAVRPHLANAYAIYRRIARLENRVDSLRAGFDHAPLGMAILDAAGRVLEINTRAEECLLATQLAVFAPTRGLLFSNPVVRQEFNAALRGFSRPDPPPVAVALRHADGAAASLALHMCRVPAGTISGFHGRARVLVFVAELRRERLAQWAESIVHVALGLSRAEARVAVALLHHHDTIATAATLGLSPETVRTHVRSIHGRLGVRRNSDLLLVLDRLLGARARIDA